MVLIISTVVFEVSFVILNNLQTTHTPPFCSPDLNPTCRHGLCEQTDLARCCQRLKECLHIWSVSFYQSISLSFCHSTLLPSFLLLLPHFLMSPLSVSPPPPPPLPSSARDTVMNSFHTTEASPAAALVCLSVYICVCVCVCVCVCACSLKCVCSYRISDSDKKEKLKMEDRGQETESRDKVYERV